MGHVFRGYSHLEFKTKEYRCIEHVYVAGEAKHVQVEAVYRAHDCVYYMPNGSICLHRYLEAVSDLTQYKTRNLYFIKKNADAMWRKHSKSCVQRHALKA